MYFRNYGLPKASLDQYKKRTASDYPWTSNMVNRPKTVEILTAARLSNLLIPVKATEFEKVTLSGMQNLKTVC